MASRYLPLLVAICCGLGLGAGTPGEAATGQPLVGAYYYPWWGPGGHSWTADNTGQTNPEELRLHLDPQQSPALGLYDSDSAAVIAGHIDQSHKANIGFWAMSWAGQNSTTDKTIRNSVLANPRAGELEYAIHYETSSKTLLGSDPSNPTYANLTPSFQYMAQNIFTDPNYLKINGRPVVFMYLTRTYFNTQAGADAVANLRSTMKTQFGYDPYIIGDDVFGSSSVSSTRAKLWDSITDFDVYGSFLQGNGSTMAGVNQMASKYDAWKASANQLGVGFVPTVSPGFNDSAYPGRNHVPAPRYLTDAPLEEGSLFTSELGKAMTDLDPMAGNILMVNSFNEWHEDTQIEATVPVAADSSADGIGTATTGGFTYPGYGDLYLNLLHDATAVPEPTVVMAAMGLAGVVLTRRRIDRDPGRGPSRITRACANCSGRYREGHGRRRR